VVCVWWLGVLVVVGVLGCMGVGGVGVGGGVPVWCGVGLGWVRLG